VSGDCAPITGRASAIVVACGVAVRSAVPDGIAGSEGPGVNVAVDVGRLLAVALGVELGVGEGLAVNVGFTVADAVGVRVGVIVGVGEDVAVGAVLTSRVPFRRPA
jgi:hypothetical protein